MKNLINLTAIVLVTLFSSMVNADVAVIVHPDNGAALTQKNITKIFLGKAKKFPGGGTVLPVTQKGVRDEFNEKVLGKSSSQVKAHWSKLVFTGKGTPPQELGSDDEVKALVAKNPSVIGYIDAASVDDSVKAVLTQ